MEKSRGRRLAGFAVRTVCFFLLTAAVLLYALYVLTPKQEYGVCSMLNLYRQPENSVDVLVLGTSLGYADVNTNILWDEYGISSYDLCSAQQPYWVSYFYLIEALKTQTPKVILLDAKASTYTDDYMTLSRSVQSTYGILSPDTRLQATLAAVESAEDIRDVLLGFPLLHKHYAEVTADDFAYPPNNNGRGDSWKGFVEQTDSEHHVRPSVVWNNVRRNMNEREITYVRRIFELAQERNIPLMLIGFPNADYENDHMYYNALWSIASEYGITGMNYNDPANKFGLRYSTDCADWQHLNVNGSVKLTRKLAEDLKSAFDLTDHRGDACYASYDECAEKWFAEFPEYRKEQEDAQ